jgi:hypothetical protein
VLGLKCTIVLARDHTENRGKLTVRVVFEGAISQDLRTRVYDWDRLSAVLAKFCIIRTPEIEPMRREIECGVPVMLIAHLTEEELRELDSNHFVH